MVDTPTGETITPAPLEPVATPPVTTSPPVVNTVDQAEVERLRKENEQARMRTAQLENEAAARKKADDEARQKQLEENAQWQTVAQEAKARADGLEAEKAETARRSELAAASQDMLKEYPEAVQRIAATTGLSLTDDSETAKAELKTKLDSLKADIGGSAPTVRPNNPPANGPVSNAPTTADERAALVTRSAPGEPSPMALASAKGDDSVVRAYVASLPAVQKMREQAQSF